MNFISLKPGLANPLLVLQFLSLKFKRTLNHKAYSVLLFLIENAGRTIGKKEFFEHIWKDAFVEDNNLTVTITAIRKALRDNENAVKIIETVPRRGYRLTARVVETIESCAPSALPEPAEAVEKPLPIPASNHRRKWLTAAAAVILIMLAALGGYFLFSAGGASSAQTPRRLAILPFTNLKPAEETDFLGYALTDALIARLAPVKSLGVRPASSVFKYRNRTPSPTQAAEELQADLLLSGSYLKEGGTVKINAELIDVWQEQVIYQDAFEIGDGTLSGLQEQISRRLINALGLSLTNSESILLDLQKPRDERAYEFYLRGIDYLCDGTFAARHRNARKKRRARCEFRPRLGLSRLVLRGQRFGAFRRARAIRTGANRV